MAQRMIFATSEIKRNSYLIEQVQAVKGHENKTGLTLVEMLVVVAIIVVLTTMVIGLAGRVTNQSKEQLTKNTIAILTSALEQFHDFQYRYVDNPVYAPAEREFYLGLDFPLDCNGFDVPVLQITLENSLGLAAGSILIDPVASHIDPNYSGGEVLYFFLSRVPECRKTLDKIDESLITNLGLDKQPMTVAVGIRIDPLLRFIDPWGTTLRYDYYNRLEPDPILRLAGKRTFPVITSAGPDKQFGTVDDISSLK
jgi:prepilin-type N-terminal cleavage/methylation domain-containing protein